MKKENNIKQINSIKFKGINIRNEDEFFYEILYQIKYKDLSGDNKDMDFVHYRYKKSLDTETLKNLGLLELYNCFLDYIDLEKVNIEL